MSAPGIQEISAALEKYLEGEGITVVLIDAYGVQHSVAAYAAAGPDAFLLLFLGAADAIWSSATGGGIGVVRANCDKALLGYRAEAIGDVPFFVVMLCIIDAIERVRDGSVLELNRLMSLAVQEFAVVAVMGRKISVTAPVGSLLASKAGLSDRQVVSEGA